MQKSTNKFKFLNEILNPTQKVESDRQPFNIMGSSVLNSLNPEIEASDIDVLISPLYNGGMRVINQDYADNYAKVRSYYSFSSVEINGNILTAAYDLKDDGVELVTALIDPDLESKLEKYSDLEGIDYGRAYERNGVHVVTLDNPYVYAKIQLLEAGYSQNLELSNDRRSQFTNGDIEIDLVNGYHFKYERNDMDILRVAVNPDGSYAGLTDDLYDHIMNGTSKSNNLTEGFMSVVRLAKYDAKGIKFEKDGEYVSGYDMIPDVLDKTFSNASAEAINAITADGQVFNELLKRFPSGGTNNYLEPTPDVSGVDSSVPLEIRYAHIISHMEENHPDVKTLIEEACQRRLDKVKTASTDKAFDAALSSIKESDSPSVSLDF